MKAWPSGFRFGGPFQKRFVHLPERRYNDSQGSVRYARNEKEEERGRR